MFEFDNTKSDSNRIKHGIDFETATELWRDPARIEIPARSDDENRFLLIAVLENKVWSAVYTKRNDRIRIISVRKSRKNEKEIYKSFRI